MLRDIYEISGEYFDEMFEFYSEDLDLGFRAILRGWKCIGMYDLYILHLHSVTTKKRGNDFSIYYNHRNQLWCIIKNYPRILLWRYWFIIIASQLSAIAYYCIRGKPLLIVRSKFDALRSLSKVLKKRHRIQKDVPVNLDYIRSLFSKESLFKLWK